MLGGHREERSRHNFTHSDRDQYKIWGWNLSGPPGIGVINHEKRLFIAAPVSREVAADVGGAYSQTLKHNMPSTVFSGCFCGKCCRSL